MSQQDRRKPQKDEDIVDGEVLAEFSDETLMNLPPVERDSRESITAPKITEPPVDSGRRQLIVRLLLGGAAALAFGGSAALLLNRRNEPNVVILPNGAKVGSEGPVDVAELVKQIADLQQSLDATAQERDELKVQLAQLTTQLQEIKPQLEEAQALNTLWKSLDDVGLDDLVKAALQILGDMWSGIVTVVGLLQSGATDVQAALDYVSNNLPKPQKGIQWLSGQITALSQSLDDLATQVQQAVAPVQPYAQMITNFVDWVLNQLPFNIGAKAKAGMKAMQTIIGGLPVFVATVSSDVLDPLAVWFGADPVRNLAGILLDPVNKKVLAPARDVIAQVTNFDSSFQTKLMAPATDALAKRADIRAQIKDLQAKSSGQS